MDTFGKFRLLKRLGAGGMGEVYLAKEEGREEALVVKRILPHLTSNPRFLRLFLDETRIASRLTHPNIARIFELGEESETWFVSMEHVPGLDLRELLRRSRDRDEAVPLELAFSIALQIARALEYAHDARDAQERPLRIVHRDVSPHNVLVSRTGQVKLIDFGVAKAANKALHTATGILKGKFPYMAPEQANARRVDRRTDVFALGIVLWETLTGMHLFRGKTDAATLKQVRACEVTPPSELLLDLPTWVDPIVLKALAKEPKARYQTAGQFAEALEEKLSGLPPADLGAWVQGLDDAPEEPGDEASTDEPETIPEAESVPTLHVRPSPAVRTHSDRSKVRTHSGVRLDRTVKLLAEVSARPTNLAPQATSFVGRVAELADLHQLFRGGARLITLLGPGGTGKTRLSIQFANQLVSHFGATVGPGKRRGGVWFCELADARDPDAICVAVARALEVQLAPGDLVLQLGHALAARGDVLLVMDNFEQAAPHAAATLERWLAAVPQARFVVSSREALRVMHEVIFEVPPLRLPERPDEVRGSEAVQLFIERARAARPGWELSPQDEAAVAEIVKQLDGLPLAIELAAARMSLLAPAQLVQRLPRRFELLGQGARAAPDRQRTLRGAIDWSWQLLKGWEQAALAQCSVFRGGFTAEGAEAVVDLAGHAEAPEVLEAVMTLRAKSLLRGYYPPEGGGDLRYGLFESIREYAQEKLLASGAEAPVRERHARYYVSVGKRLSAEAESSPAALDALSLERENLNAVFQRAVETGQRGPRALAAVLALDPLLSVRGPFGAHLAMLDASLAVLGDQDRAYRVLGLEARGRARQVRGRVAEAALDYQEMLSLAQAQAMPELEGRALVYLATVERVRANRAEARRLYERALETLRRVGDRRYEGRALANLGVLLQEMGQEEQATQCYLDGLEIHRQVNDRRIEGVTLANLGVQQQNQGLYAQARRNYEAALEIHRELGNRKSEGIAHINLGDLARELHEPTQAVTHYQKALEILREGGFRRFEGIARVSLGSLRQELGDLDEAERDLQDGVGVLAEVGDRRYEGLSRAALAGVLATLGELPRAEVQLAQATAKLNEANDLSFLEALDLYRAHLELAQALRAPTDGEADALERRIASRVVRAESPAPIDAAHPNGGPSPADQSEHVRAALRSLKAALKRASAGP